MTVSDVLADLLAMASEADRLVETDRLLRELAGGGHVDAAHEVWTDRLREGLLRGGEHAAPRGRDVPASDDVFELTRRLRATRPAGLPW